MEEDATITHGIQSESARSEEWFSGPSAAVKGRKDRKNAKKNVNSLNHKFFFELLGPVLIVYNF